MSYVFHLVHTVIAALEVWSPMQLLLVAAATILLGYVGLVARVAWR